MWGNRQQAVSSEQDRAQCCVRADTPVRPNSAGESERQRHRLLLLANVCHVSFHRLNSACRQIHSLIPGSLTNLPQRQTFCPTNH